jgi:hypothetical protein
VSTGFKNYFAHPNTPMEIPKNLLMTNCNPLSMFNPHKQSGNQRILKTMKLSKLVSLISLLTLITISSASAQGPAPFGKVRLNGTIYEEADRNGKQQKADFHTKDIMQLVVDAINTHEDTSYVIPKGAYLSFNGSDMEIRTADGSLFLNLSNSPRGGNYFSLTLSDKIITRIHESKNKFAATTSDLVEIVFNSTPTLNSQTLTKQSISAAPSGFTLNGRLKTFFEGKNNKISDAGSMSGSGFGGLTDDSNIHIKWRGFIAGQQLQIL